MHIGISTSDRFEFESAVDFQGIRVLVNSINSQLIYTPGMVNILTINPSGPMLHQPIPMGPNQSYRLPYTNIDVTPDSIYNVPISFKILNTMEGFQIVIDAMPQDWLQRSVLLANFDEYMNLTHFSIQYGAGVTWHSSARVVLMDALFRELPSLLGYIVTWNSRNRVPVTLGEPHEWLFRGSENPSVQNMGDIHQVTNPRDNPTGLTKRPHERATHDRRLADGRIIEVQGSIIHPEDYVPSTDPKIFKH